jgi:hypothetical protein
VIKVHFKAKDELNLKLALLLNDVAEEEVNGLSAIILLRALVTEEIARRQAARGVKREPLPGQAKLFEEA